MSDLLPEPEKLSDRLPREHGGSLCILDHICPNCKPGIKSARCLDIFEDPNCGGNLVACNADDPQS